MVSGEDFKINQKALCAWKEQICVKRMGLAVVFWQLLVVTVRESVH